jgi:hypothetical protein
MYISLYVKYRLFLSDFNKTRIFSLDFFISKKYSNIRSHENLSGGSLVVPHRRTDGQADMTKLRVAFRNLANARKNSNFGPFSSPLNIATGVTTTVI